VFLGADGSLDPEVYLPAFARRYPFLPIIASEKPGQATGKQDERVLVCIDRAAKMVSSTPERPFFEGEQPSKYTQDAIQFCREFDMLGMRTQEFCKVLDKHGLFETTPLAVPRAKPDGTPDEPLKMGEYLRVSEKKLQELPKEAYLELREMGPTLPFIHAHLISLFLWPKILSRAARIQASTPLS
jgi:hypothetical protein